MWQTYYRPETLDGALDLLRAHAEHTRIIAGGTDLIVEFQRGIRSSSSVLDISALPDLRYIRAQDDLLCLGGLTTHNDVLASALCRAQAAPLVQACLEVGAPQIRARATLAGNLVTASPANDTISPLIALDAHLALLSRGGERVLPLEQFYLGVRRTALQTDELVREIRFAPLSPAQRGAFVKLGLRRAQAISVINLAVVITLDPSAVVVAARIALGCVAPTVVRARETEQFLVGRRLSAAVCREAGRLACDEVRPITDLRGSASYRLEALASLLAHTLQTLVDGDMPAMLPAHPVLLETVPASVGRASPPSGQVRSSSLGEGSAAQAPKAVTAIDTTINGHPYRFEASATRTLLEAIREEAGLTGTKEGCAEGECGACTVWLDGQAVMSCLVPAAQASGAAITTIEGLGGIEGCHPLQQAFIRCGAVQCGYCIPGMLMAGAKLLQEHPDPDLEQVRTAISGNLCRCTGYRKIQEAMLAAATTAEDVPQEGRA
jgi:xanthine dehydrogenase iron-sulfur cluster and FAD-binding subunit A